MYTIWYNIYEKDNLKHARTCVYNINYHIVLSVKYHQKMYKKFPDLCQQLWKGEFWNYSYYLEIIDDISEETIRMYIEHQSKQYWRKPANKKSSVFLKKISKIRFDILCITFKPPEMPALKVVI